MTAPTLTSTAPSAASAAIRRFVAVAVLIAALTIAFTIGRISVDSSSASRPPALGRATSRELAPDHSYDTCRFGRPC